VKALLSNNDINATAVAIEVTQKPLQPLKVQFHVSPAFWEFYFSPTHTLELTKPESAKAKSLVRIAYKAFQMGLPFLTGGVDPTSELLVNSHFDKIQEMKEWEKSPFQNYQVVVAGGGKWKCQEALPCFRPDSDTAV